MTIAVDIRRGADERGYYIRTFTNKQFFWSHIESNVYDIRDIAHALAMNCRWTGHTKSFYSVAQHCVYASYEVPAEHAMSALLHDAAEAYMHDTPSPLKWFLREKGFLTFSDLETRIEKVIFETFGVPFPIPDVVKEADQRLLATEHRDLMPQGKENKFMYEPYEWHVQPLSPEQAEKHFLRRYKQLKELRDAKPTYTGC